MSKAQERLQAQIKYARAHVLESQAWEVARERDAFDSPTYKTCVASLDYTKKKAMDEFAAAGGHLVNRQIIGWLDMEDERSHYDIDDLLRNRFGDDPEVVTDSESGMFCCLFSRRREAKIVQLIQQNFPLLRYGEVDDCDPVMPFMGNWDSAKRFLVSQEGSIPVGKFDDIVPVRTEEELTELVDEALNAYNRSGLTYKEFVSRMNLRA